MSLTTQDVMVDDSRQAGAIEITPEMVSRFIDLSEGTIDFETSPYNLETTIQILLSASCQVLNNSQCPQ